MMRGIRKSLKGEKGDKRSSSNSGSGSGSGVPGASVSGNGSSSSSSSNNNNSQNQNQNQNGGSSSSHSRMSSINGSSSNFTASLVASSSASISAHSNNSDAPKKIIRATQDHAAASPQELSFQSGDFYWVVGRENDAHYYEACNPLTNVKGLVPVSCFEVLNQRKRPDSYSTGKNNNSFIISNLHLSNSPSALSPERFSSSGPGSRRPSLAGHPASFSSSSSSTAAAAAGGGSHASGVAGGAGASASASAGSSSANPVLYGIVMYDFEARPGSDELDVKKGEYLILCAHHEFEWFIAKPINRLGGPGLVPVGYVKTLNLATKKVSGGDIIAEIKDASLPTVEEWKSKTAKYKAASISLTEDEYYASNQHHQHHQQYQHQRPHAHHGQQVHQRTLYEYDDVASQSSGGSKAPPHSYNIYTASPYNAETSSLYDAQVHVTDVYIDNFYYNRLSANDERQGRFWYHVVAKLSNNKTRSLARYYDDFYEFQVQLKKHEFPAEHDIPSIPAPVPNVTAVTSFARYTKLNEYLQNLLSLPHSVSRSKVVLSFFSLRKDVDKQIDAEAAPAQHGQDAAALVVPALPDVVGFNENGLEKYKLEQAQLQLGVVPSASTTNTSIVPPPSLHHYSAANSARSARSSAETKESGAQSHLSYQMAQLNMNNNNSSSSSNNNNNSSSHPSNANANFSGVGNGFKTDSISTNATSHSEGGLGVAASEEGGDNAGNINGNGNGKPSLKISTTTSATPGSGVQYIGIDSGKNGSSSSANLNTPPAPPSSSSSNMKIKNAKIKFFYEDDIFAISVPTNTTLLDLKMKIGNRISFRSDKIRLFVRGKSGSSAAVAATAAGGAGLASDGNDADLGNLNNDDDYDLSSKEIDSDDILRSIMQKDPKLKLIIITDDEMGGDDESNVVGEGSGGAGTDGDKI